MKKNPNVCPDTNEKLVEISIFDPVQQKKKKKNAKRYKNLVKQEEEKEA